MKSDEYIAGVDYSLTSPAVCVAKVVNDDITFENCTFHFLKQTKSQKSFDKIYSYDYPEFHLILKDSGKLSTNTMMK